jgi:hypothetical protein
MTGTPSASPTRALRHRQGAFHPESKGARAQWPRLADRNLLVLTQGFFTCFGWPQSALPMVNWATDGCKIRT